jgi:hypothetical protein
MADIQRVPGPGAPFLGRGNAAAVAVVVLVAVLIAKPWGGATAGPEATAQPLPSVAAPTAAPTPVAAGYAFDQSIFGPFEPSPEWSIWPAGFFVTVLYVSRETHEDPGPPPSPAVSGSAGPSPTVSGEQDWPAVIRIGPGDHLLWLGMDTPVEWTVREAMVWRLGDGGARTAVPVAQLASAWGPHFSVIGIPLVIGSDRLTIWPHGSYELEVTLDPGGLIKRVQIEVETLDLVSPDGVEGRTHQTRQ